MTIVAATDPDCETRVFTKDVEISGDGIYGASFTPAAMGRYYWEAVYPGDDDNDEAGTGCTQFSTVGKATPALSISATDAKIGNPVSASATLTGGHHPTGATTYRAYSTADCSGDPIAEAATFTPAAPGVYHWIATYAGDADNASVSTACNAANSTVSDGIVLAAGTPAVVSPAVPLTLTGVSGPRCISQGAGTTARFTVSASTKVTFTLMRRTRPVPLTRSVCPGPLPGINPSATYKRLRALGGRAVGKGRHRVTLDTHTLAPGRYRVVITAGGVSASFSFWVLTRARG
jgi:hypothetical protein